MDNQLLHEVVITAIIMKEGKFLITRRSATKKRFPGMWTVPGGKLETSDYTSLPKQTKDYWYNVLEQTLRREVREEVGIEIDNISYLTSLARVHEDGTPSLVISCTAEYVSGDVTLDASESDDFAWVSHEESKQYKLIDGIYDELVMIEKKLRGEKVEWERVNADAKV
jgi:8-oxo-dGTP diphosphatase